MRSGAIVLLVCLGLVSVASAQDAPPAAADTPPSESQEVVGDQAVESARHAREEFRAGVEHYQAGRYLEAIHSFQVAASLIPSADLWFNIASAYEQLARTRGEVTDFEQAIVHYRRYLTEQVDPPDRAAVEANLAYLGERLEAARAAQTVAATQGTLRVRSSFAGASVSVDDEVVGPTPIDREVALAPGRHRVEATRDGYVPYLAEVSLELGLTVTTQIDLVPAHRHRAITQAPVFAWVAWGLAVASLGGSIAVGALAQGALPQSSDPGNCGPMGAGACDLWASSRELGAFSDGLLAATAGLAVVGIALFFIEGRAVGTVTEVTEQDGADGARSDQGGRVTEPGDVSAEE